MRLLVWVGFASLVSLGIGLPLTGCDNLFGLARVQEVPVDKDNGYVCTCDCTYPDGGTSTADINVCMLGSQNPNLEDGRPAPTAEQLRDDCATERVQVQVQRMARECYARGADCSCRVAGTAEAPTPVTFYAEVCDEGCAARPLVITNGVCTNWDGANGIANANCATDNLCNDPGPVCLGPFGDLAGAMMGRLTQCDVGDGDITVNVDGSERVLGVSGAVQFLPIPCGGGQTCVVPSYLLRSSGSMSFDALGGLESVSVRDIRTLGTSSALLLDEFGAGQIAENGSINSGRAIQTETTVGFDETKQVNVIGGNDDPIDLLFDGAQCGIDGALAGGVGDPEGDNAGFALNVNFTGAVVNTPPNADLGDDQTVECTDSTGADVTLDASGSTDAENNIVHYGWFGDTRAGADLGTGVTLELHQALGARIYFVKPVDAYMQADEDDVTVTVQDSTGPTIACNAPATITPRRTPYAFTATASDACGSVSGAPTVTGFECFAFNASGKRVTRRCRVQFSGGTFTIVDSGGIGDHFVWTVDATDSNGQKTTQTCETEVVRPGPGPT